MRRSLWKVLDDLAADQGENGVSRIIERMVEREARKQAKRRVA